LAAQNPPARCEMDGVVSPHLAFSSLKVEATG
jgi:hypothetical protein